MGQRRSCRDSGAVECVTSKNAALESRRDARIKMRRDADVRRRRSRRKAR